MFTGLVEYQTDVLINEDKGEGKRLLLASPYQDIQPGESIAVNGVCLTCLPSESRHLHFDVSPETLEKTTLGQLTPGQMVNLERAMQPHSRFGGHYVSGHVDAKAQLHQLQTVGDYLQMTVCGFEEEAFLYLIAKGSITLDGVSLTINQVEKNSIHLMLVPHTLAATTLGKAQIGHLFNVEFDYLTRIVAHQLRISGQLKKEVYS